MKIPPAVWFLAICVQKLSSRGHMRDWVERNHYTSGPWLLIARSEAPVTRFTNFEVLCLCECFVRVQNDSRTHDQIPLKFGTNVYDYGASAEFVNWKNRSTKTGTGIKNTEDFQWATIVRSFLPDGWLWKSVNTFEKFSAVLLWNK